MWIGLPAWIVAASLAGCGSASPPGAMDFARQGADEEAPSPTVASAPAAVPPAAEMAEGAAGGARRDAEKAGKAARGNAAGRMENEDAKSVAADDAPADGGAPERTRSWFPEAFLWQPLVETGADGTAQVPFTVPDSLTTWRVLALAHDRTGQQTGAVHTFDSTLPVYVDPVVPGWLFAGDRLVLPVQVMNNTAEAVSGTLSLTAEGPLSGAGTAQVSLLAGASDVRGLPLDVTGAGEARLTAVFRAGSLSDAAERVVPVQPTGRPEERTAGGTLTDRRTIAVPGPSDADPTTEELEVVLFGGPLAVLDAELARVAAGARPVDAAYGFALAGRLVALSDALAQPIDPQLLRKVRLLTWQRVVREARAADAGVAADLSASMTGELGVESAGPVRSALRRSMIDGQRADGTWGRRPQSTLQELLVNTAWVGRAVPVDEKATRLRAESAIERFLHEVKDPYTAAVVLASGLLSGDAAEPLQKLLTDAIVRGDDGVPRLEVPTGVVNPWGVRPSAAEATAFAVLALPPGAEARRDLAASLLMGWSAVDGFGAGRADALALEAIATALPAIPDPVTVSLSAGGRVLASGALDPTKPGEPLLLSTRAPAGGAFELVADPPVAGVAFVATRRAWVPWSDADRIRGVDLTVTAPGLQVGSAGELAIELLAASGHRVRVEQPLPAGMAVDAAAVLAANPRLTTSGLTVLTDRVVLESEPFAPATPQTYRIPVTPAFAGEFSTAPVRLSVDGGAPVAVRPHRFTVGSAPGT